MQSLDSGFFPLKYDIQGRLSSVCTGVATHVMRLTTFSGWVESGYQYTIGNVWGKRLYSRM